MLELITFFTAGPKDVWAWTVRKGSNAVEAGGNCPLSEPGKVVTKYGVKIVGHRNMPSRLAADTSALFARNLYNFLSAFWDKERNAPVLDEEIGNAIRLTQGGKVVNERLLG